MIRIGCLHAHYSNIEGLERELGAYEVELVHFVDPGLDRLKRDAGFTLEMAESRVEEWLRWIEGSHVDAILITCTYFTAILRDSAVSRTTIPVIKIDDPLFEDANRQGKPLLFVFTNPSTVEGTLRRFQAVVGQSGQARPVEVRVLEGTFEVLMQGNKKAYDDMVFEGLCRIVAEHPDSAVVAAQLSMVGAAREAGLAAGTILVDPLLALTGHMERVLRLKRLG